jgi:hypothetical protein
VAASGINTAGNNDPAVSDYLKTWIKQGDLAVCGVTGEGTAKEITCNWDSPFEGEDLGSKMKMTSSIAQYYTKQTTVTTLNTAQIWNGNRPTQFSLNLIFYALRDAQKEVMDALMYLEQMASPQLDAAMPFSVEGNLSEGYSFNAGRIPGLVTISIGRKAIYPDCVIESISQPLDKEVTSDGLLVRAEVQMQVSTSVVPNRDKISQFYSGSV